MHWHWNHLRGGGLAHSRLLMMRCWFEIEYSWPDEPQRSRKIQEERSMEAHLCAAARRMKHDVRPSKPLCQPVKKKLTHPPRPDRHHQAAS